MIRLFRFLFTGDWHLHKWVIIKEISWSDAYGAEWTQWVQKCEHCGKLQKKDNR